MALDIDESVCKGCRICVHYCPGGVLHMSQRVNPKGYIVAEVGTPEKCKKCRLCEINCPDLAICFHDHKEANSSQ